MAAPMRMPNKPAGRGGGDPSASRRQFVLAAAAGALSSVWSARSEVASAETGSVPAESSPTNASRHYVSFQAPIDDTTSARLIAIVGGLIQKGVNDIYLIVNTGGGNVADAVLIYGFLRSLPAKVTTHNLSTIQSAGEIIFLAGEKRIASQNAIFQFHHLNQNFTSNTSLTSDDFKDRETLLSLDIKRVDEIYRERTSLTATQLEEFKRHAVYFDAAAARDVGIIQEIAPLSILPRATITAVNPKD
jgi:ATP-dependent Clp protease, protease subunit